MGGPTTPTQETKVPTWAPYTPKRHTRPYFGCAERAYVQNAQNFHSWGVLGMRLPCVVFIQVHRQANAQLLTHIFITQVLHIQRMPGVLTEASRVHPRATLQRHSHAAAPERYFDVCWAHLTHQKPTLAYKTALCY